MNLVRGLATTLGADLTGYLATGQRASRRPANNGRMTVVGALRPSGGRPGDGLLTEQIADARGCCRELVKMPPSGHGPEPVSTVGSIENGRSFFPVRVSDVGRHELSSRGNGAAFESLRRTNPRENGERLAGYGDLARERLRREMVFRKIAENWKPLRSRTVRCCCRA